MLRRQGRKGEYAAALKEAVLEKDREMMFNDGASMALELKCIVPKQEWDEAYEEIKEGEYPWKAELFLSLGDHGLYMVCQMMSLQRKIGNSSSLTTRTRKAPWRK